MANPLCHRMLETSRSADPSLQHASASVVRAIAHKSPDVFARHNSLVLPLAFYGMHERSESQKNQSTVNETT